MLYLMPLFVSCKDSVVILSHASGYMRQLSSATLAAVAPWACLQYPYQMKLYVSTTNTVRHPIPVTSELSNFAKYFQFLLH